MTKDHRHRAVLLLSFAALNGALWLLTAEATRIFLHTRM